MSSDTRDHLYAVKLFTGFITAVILVIILQELRTIFIPLFMSVLLYFLFNGVVQRLIRLKIPRGVVLVFLLIFIFILFYFLGALLFSSASAFVKKFPAYSQKVLEVLTGLSEQLKIPISDVNNYIDKIDWVKSIDTSQVTTLISGTFGSFAAFLGNLVMVLIFLMFMLAGRNSMGERLYKAFKHERADKLKGMVDSIEDQVQHYLLIKTFMSLLTGLICGILLFIGRFDFVIFSALFIFVLNYIPTFGSIIGTALPIVIGFLQYGFSLRVLLVGIGLMLTQFVIGNIIEPKFTGKSLNLSPIVILIALIFWGYIWGAVGMMLAVPLTSAMKIMFQNIPDLKPLAELISSD